MSLRLGPLCWTYIYIYMRICMYIYLGFKVVPMSLLLDLYVVYIYIYIYANILGLCSSSYVLIFWAYICTIWVFGPLWLLARFSTRLKGADHPPWS